MTDKMNIYVFDLNGNWVTDPDYEDAVILSEDRGRWTAEFSQFYTKDGEMTLSINPPVDVTPEQVFAAIMAAYKTFKFE